MIISFSLPLSPFTISLFFDFVFFIVSKISQSNIIIEDFNNTSIRSKEFYAMEIKKLNCFLSPPFDCFRFHLES